MKGRDQLDTGQMRGWGGNVLSGIGFLSLNPGVAPWAPRNPLGGAARSGMAAAARKLTRKSGWPLARNAMSRGFAVVMISRSPGDFLAQDLRFAQFTDRARRAWVDTWVGK